MDSATTNGLILQISYDLYLYSLSKCSVAAGTTSVTKEKRNWFYSLTRRKKSDSALASSSSTAAVATAGGSQSAQLQNNNNEPLGAAMETSCSSAAASDSNSSSLGGALRKRKDKKNMFSRIRKKMGLGLSALRNWHSMGDDCDCDGGTTDAMYEFLAPPIRVEPTLPFTHDYMRFIKKKWLEQQDAPNEVMYKACSEMLKYVKTCCYES